MVHRQLALTGLVTLVYAPFSIQLTGDVDFRGVPWSIRPHCPLCTWRSASSRRVLDRSLSAPSTMDFAAAGVDREQRPDMDAVSVLNIESPGSTSHSSAPSIGQSGDNWSGRADFPPSRGRVSEDSPVCHRRSLRWGRLGVTTADFRREVVSPVHGTNPVKSTMDGWSKQLGTFAGGPHGGVPHHRYTDRRGICSPQVAEVALFCRCIAEKEGQRRANRPPAWHPGAFSASCLFTGPWRVILGWGRRGHHAAPAVFHRGYRALVEREAKYAPIFSARKEGEGNSAGVHRVE